MVDFVFGPKQLSRSLMVFMALGVRLALRRLAGICHSLRWQTLTCLSSSRVKLSERFSEPLYANAFSSHGFHLVHLSSSFAECSLTIFLSPFLQNSRLTIFLFLRLPSVMRTSLTGIGIGSMHSFMGPKLTSNLTSSLVSSCLLRLSPLPQLQLQFVAELVIILLTFLI